MSRIRYNDYYEYEIFDDGYDIYYEDSKISQREPYAHIYISGGSYEENCLAQLESLTTEPEPEITEETKLRADVDYMAIMMDVDLPSYEKEGE